MTFAELKIALERSGREVPVADLSALGRFVIAAIKQGDFIIGRGLDETAALLHRRADAMALAELPPHHGMEI